MSGVDTRPVPTNLLRWPRTKDLVTQYKGILMYLWAHPQQTNCGCYLLPLDATAADLSMSAGSLADAISEFERRGLVHLDPDTGEIMLLDWFRFYTPRTAPARGATESAIRKVLSTGLRKKVENLYKSKVDGCKGKDKDKDKDKASSKEEEAKLRHATLQRRGPGSQLSKSAAGITCWTDGDRETAKQLEDRHGIEKVREVVALANVSDQEPLPSRISRLLNQSTAGVMLPQAWWSSEAGTEEAARILGLSAHVGEYMGPFRQRIRDAIHDLNLTAGHAKRE